MAVNSGWLSLEELVAEANKFHRETVRALRQAIYHAKDAGDALNKAKGWLKHERRAGRTVPDFMAWVGDNFDGSHRTANDYMRIARNWKTLQLTANAEGLTIAQALQVLKTRESGKLVRPQADADPADNPEAGARADARAEQERLLEHLRGWVELLPRQVVRALAEDECAFMLLFRDLKLRVEPLAWACWKARRMLPDRDAFIEFRDEELAERLQGDPLSPLLAEVLEALTETAVATGRAEKG